MRSISCNVRSVPALREGSGTSIGEHARVSEKSGAHYPPLHCGIVTPLAREQSAPKVMLRNSIFM
jgi:hypothetical protein